MSLEKAASFKVWAEDNTVYGPVDLDTVVQWIQDERVFPETFVQFAPNPRWYQACDLEPLRGYFPADTATVSQSAKPDVPAAVTALRDLAVFAGVDDAGLEQLVALGSFLEVEPGSLVVHKGDPCDAVYFILSGELRVRLVVGVVDHEDKTLCKIGSGEFFGELGVFLQGKRTADVLAETPSQLFRMATSAFLLMVRQIPELGAPILFNIGVTTARRMAEDNQRFYREVTSQYLWI